MLPLTQEPSRIPSARAPIWAARGALGGILLVAAMLRFVGIDWDAGQHLHPDERFITMVESQVRLPDGLANYFDTARSALNPYNHNFGSFIYGTLPLFLVRALGEVLQQVAKGIDPTAVASLADLLGHLRNAADYGDVHRIGRVLSGIEDLVTVWLVFVIGRRLYGQSVGLLGALFSGLAVLQIQAAHFFTAESPLILLTTLAVYLAVRVAQTNELPSWLFLGIAVGLAIATKLTAGLILLVVLAAAWIVWRRRWLSGTGDFSLENLVTGIVVAGVSAAIAFRVAQPYAFSGPGFFDLAPNPKYLADVESWQRIASGQADYPPSNQWTGSTPYVWQLVNMALWGLGPPLFLAAWLGVALAIVQIVRHPARYQMHLLGLVWVLANFLYWGPQFAKPMRYLLPVYPLLALFAAFALVTAWKWAGRGEISVWPGWRLSPLAGSVLVSALTVVVVGWTAFYAVAFASIYARPTTRVAASEWIYANIPDGATIAWEHWDDPLPLRLPGTNADRFAPQIQLNPYDEDTPLKRDELIEKLDKADYVVLSSNRLYGSIPKLPLRYPLTIRYYHALFGGDLGFQSVAEFVQRPSLLGIELNDDNAEEIFTVYEHPKVTIFEKTSSYSLQNTRGVLQSVNLDQVIKGLKPIDAKTAGLLLTPDERAADQAGGTWRDLFNPDDLANQMPILVWYLTLQILGWVAFPLLWWACRGLFDRGYILAKTVGWLAIAYIPWLAASLHLMPFSRLSILSAVFLLAVASGLILRRHWSEIVTFVEERWRQLVVLEAFFGAVLVVFAMIRAVNPDLWHPSYGGEKPMDFAYLNAVIRTTWFPPYDPWLAGGYINYYYFGFVVIAALVKLTGIVPWVGYNLAVPTLAALTALNAAAVAFYLLVGRERTPVSRQKWAAAGGVLAAFLAVGAGNLAGLGQVLAWLDRVGGGPTASLVPGLGTAVGAGRGLLVVIASPLSGQNIPALNFNFWDPTRVITTESVTPITEFPFFTFLYADLHAHMIAMPLALVALALAVNLVRHPLQLPREWLVGARTAARSYWGREFISQPTFLVLVLVAWVVGVLRMTNTWDYPTYAALAVLAFWVGLRFEARETWTASIMASVVMAGALFAVSTLFVAPFLARYQQFYSGIGLAPGHTNLAQYLTILGIPLGLIATYLALQLAALRPRLETVGLSLLELFTPSPVASSLVASKPMTRSDGSARETLLGVLTLVVLAAAVALWFAGLQVVATGAVVVLALGLLLVMRPWSAAGIYLITIVGVALLLTMAVEIVVLQGDIGRMNTVFKFYIQAWLLLAIGAAVVITLLARRLVGSPWLRAGGRRALAIGLAILLGAAAIYPLLGTPSRLQHRFGPLPLSLDGMAYMADAHYEDNNKDLRLPDDFDGIRWLLQNVDGSPVIAEGNAPLYHWGSRVSIYTGMPIIIGWDWHQKQQRGHFGFMVDDRLRDVAAIFGSASPDATRGLLRKYRVEYVYVGGLERAFYSADNLRKFEVMTPSALTQVYSNGAVTIYRVQAD